MNYSNILGLDLTNVKLDLDLLVKIVSSSFLGLGIAYFGFEIELNQ